MTPNPVYHIDFAQTLTGHSAHDPKFFFVVDGGTSSATGDWLNTADNGTAGAPITVTAAEEDS